jgi:hypothetical protein
VARPEEHHFSLCGWGVAILQPHRTGPTAAVCSGHPSARLAATLARGWTRARLPVLHGTEAWNSNTSESAAYLRRLADRQRAAPSRFYLVVNRDPRVGGPPCTYRRRRQLAGVGAHGLRPASRPGRSRARRRGSVLVANGRCERAASPLRREMNLNFRRYSSGPPSSPPVLWPAPPTLLEPPTAPGVLETAPVPSVPGGVGLPGPG